MVILILSQWSLHKTSPSSSHSIRILYVGRKFEPDQLQANSIQLEPTQAKWVAKRYPTPSKLWTWLQLAWVAGGPAFGQGFRYACNNTATCIVLTFGRKRSHTSTVKMVALLLKAEDNEDIKAAIMTAIIRPTTPMGRTLSTSLQQQKSGSNSCNRHITISSNLIGSINLPIKSLIEHLHLSGHCTKWRIRLDKETHYLGSILTDKLVHGICTT